jgi:hypothetical protein
MIIFNIAKLKYKFLRKTKVKNILTIFFVTALGGGGGGGDEGGSLEETIPGVPGEDYPINAEVPDTGFSCDGRVSHPMCP